MSLLAKRTTSSFVAISLLFIAYWFFQVVGVVILGACIVLVGAFEYQRIAFVSSNVNLTHRIWFMLICLVLIVLNLSSNFSLSSSSTALGGTVFLIVVSSAGILWLYQNNKNNSELLNLIALSVLGYFYCALLPVFALKTLLHEHGLHWFVFLCSTVFTGDIMAYLGGRLCGKHKLQPHISPNKTREGAFSGFIGSLLAGALVGTIWLPFAPLQFLIIVAALCSVLAQTGDLFESLLKRVAQVKDSGTIMPGHGGVLDRLDGIYFAAPIVYFAAQSI